MPHVTDLIEEVLSCVRNVGLYARNVFFNRGEPGLDSGQLGLNVSNVRLGECKVDVGAVDFHLRLLDI